MDEEIQLLATGFSKQSSYANKVWLTLAVISIVALASPKNSNEVDLPFEIGKVQLNWFYFLSTVIISVITIGFCVAQAQMIRTQKLINKKLTELSKNWKDTNIHPRDLYDSMIQPAMLKVSPIAQVFRGKYQFYPDVRNCPQWRIITSTIIYAYVKLLGLGTFYVIPLFALYTVSQKYWDANKSELLLVIITFILIIGSFIVVAILLTIEIAYMFEVISKISRRNDENITTKNA